MEIEFVSPAYVCGEYFALFWVHMGLTKNLCSLVMQDLLQTKCPLTVTQPSAVLF